MFLEYLLKKLNGKPVRTDKDQNNPGTAPATVNEFKPITQPLRINVGRRSADRYITRESGDRPVVVNMHSGGRCCG